jgi:hypothetical protein
MVSTPQFNKNVKETIQFEEMHISLPIKVKNCKEYMLREAGIRLNMPI